MSFPSVLARLSLVGAIVGAAPVALAARVAVLVPNIDGRPLRFCSNVTETEDGTIYFTESTSSSHYEHFRAAILEAAP